MIIEMIFGFMLEKKHLSFAKIRPKPPKGYIDFDSHKVGPTCGKCPNCGEEKPGIVWKGGGFQDRQIQNISNAMDRIHRRGLSTKRCQYELFTMEIDQEDSDSTLLRDHPSRYGLGEFMCCGAKIWNDYFDDENSRYGGDGWKHYYKPTDDKTLMRFINNEKIMRGTKHEKN